MTILASMVLTATTLAAVVVDATSDGKTIRAAEGRTVIVRLEAQPGTGYRWQVKQLARNLRQIGKSEFARKAEAGVTGGAEIEVFRFRVRGKAKGTLDMIYVQPWEKGKPPRRLFRVAVDSR
jgi:predicted secreted protein